MINDTLENTVNSPTDRLTPLVNKSVFSFLRQLTTWHCPHLLLCAVLQPDCCWPPARRPCSNRSISPGRRAHSSKPAAAACDGRLNWGTERQTDGRTDARQLHRSCSTHYAGSADNQQLPMWVHIVCHDVFFVAVVSGIPQWVGFSARPSWNHSSVSRPK